MQTCISRVFFLVCVCYTMPQQVTSKMSILVTVRIKRIFFTTLVESQNVPINPKFRCLWKHLNTRAISISCLLLECIFPSEFGQLVGYLFKSYSHLVRRMRSFCATGSIDQPHFQLPKSEEM